MKRENFVEIVQISMQAATNGSAETHRQVRLRQRRHHQRRPAQELTVGTILPAGGVEM